MYMREWGGGMRVKSCENVKEMGRGGDAIVRSQQQQQQQHLLLLPDCDGVDVDVAGDDAPPSIDVQAWAESQQQIRDLLAFPNDHTPLSSPSTPPPPPSDSSGPTQMRGHSAHRIGSPALRRERWRNLVKKLKRHSPPLSSFLKDACNSFANTGAFQHSDIQSFTSTGMEPSAHNLERRLEHGGQTSSSIISLECQLQNGRNDWGWRDGCTDIPPWESGMGSHHQANAAHTPAGRVIVVKWGDLTRKIGIDGCADAIKDAIRSAFGLRSKRLFWVEDEDGVVRSFDRTMPLTNYNLHIDPGVTIKLYHYDECNRQVVNTEDATLYGEDDFRELLSRYGWQGLREVGTCKDVESIQDLRPMATYHQTRFKGMDL